MGFDICGAAPTSADGEYFRRSFLQWPPLVNLIYDLCPEESHDYLGWLYNEGHGLNAVDASRLARRLLSLEAQGVIEAYCRYQSARADAAYGDCDLFYTERHPELNVRCVERSTSEREGGVRLDTEVITRAAARGVSMDAVTLCLSDVGQGDAAAIEPVFFKVGPWFSEADVVTPVDVSDFIRFAAASGGFSIW